MSSAVLVSHSRSILQHSRWDALLIGLALVHGAVVATIPAAPIIALGLWWNSNTISHYFLHKPFFRARGLNLLFSLYLSCLLGVPQTLWRDRHLAHHAGQPWQARMSLQLAAEAVMILALWISLVTVAPLFFFQAYGPGYLAGLGLCWLHGYFEHARGTISHHGTLYNLLFFNDGYHVEHHAHPGIHWRRLPGSRDGTEPASRWPAVFRWLDLFSLEALERCVLHSQFLRRYVLQRHERAFLALLPELSGVKQVAIVGGGLFPRTLLILRKLLPESRCAVIDRCAANLRTARDWIEGEVDFIHEVYDPGRQELWDLVVIPLSFQGDREAIYRRPPARVVVVHDWIWRRRGHGAVVSWLLLKRLNLVRP